eukprot:2581845-Prymnesium_polylepis.1
MSRRATWLRRRRLTWLRRVRHPHTETHRDVAAHEAGAAARTVEQTTRAPPPLSISKWILRSGVPGHNGTVARERKVSCCSPLERGVNTNGGYIGVGTATTTLAQCGFWKFTSAHAGLPHCAHRRCRGRTQRFASARATWSEAWRRSGSASERAPLSDGAESVTLTSRATRGPLF